MSKNQFKALVQERLRRALGEGLEYPVVACLWLDSPHARAAYLERHGRPLGSPQGDERTDVSILETWSPAEATRLLRRHAGIGGAAVANLIESMSEAVGWWLLDWQEPSLAVKAFGNRRLFDNIVLYDQLLDTVCTRCRKKARGRGAIGCHLGDGHTTVVCGASRKQMLAAVQLATLVYTGCLESLSLGNTKARLKLKDQDLALILSRLFLGEPAVVAEAVRALRKVPGERDGWLIRVLDGTPDLRDLATPVRREIEGE